MKKALLFSTLLALFWFGGISLAATITHYPDSNISYTLNGNENYTAGTITITDWTDTITMLDRNLWATAAGIGYDDQSRINPAAYWYHFQWWNNYWFDSYQLEINLKSWQVNGNLVNNWYTDWFFHYWYDNWIDDNNKIDMRWWSISDNYFNLDDGTWKVNNATERQWPCPEWFHVPSYWELKKVFAMADNNFDSMHNGLLIPVAWFRSSREAYLVNRDFSAYLWSSSPSLASTPGSRSLQLIRNLQPTSSTWEIILTNRGTGRSIRCFYNTYDTYQIPKTKITSIDISWVTDPTLWQHATISWLSVTSIPEDTINLWAVSWATVWEPFSWWTYQTGRRCLVGDAGCETFSATQNWDNYQLRLVYTPKEWYEMAEDYTVTTDWNGEIETWYDTVFDFHTIRIKYLPSEIPPSIIESIYITWITTPIVWEAPNTGWISSLTEWLSVVESNTWGNIRRTHRGNANFWTFDLWEKYEIYIPFTLSDWYVLSSSNHSARFNWQEGQINTYNQYITFRFIATAPIDPNTTVTHYPSENNDIHYTLNENEYFSAGTITITNWTDTITILDRNLWATAAGTGCEWWRNNCLGDPTYWYHFQWWNNYGFTTDWTITTSSTQVDASGYWPWNYYSNSSFITWFEDWSSTPNSNLWGWSEDDNTFNVNDETRKLNNASERQWPCPEWFHVPSYWELKKISNMLWDNQMEIHNQLLIPLAGYRDKNNASIGHDDFSNYASLWSSSPSLSPSNSLGLALGRYNNENMERFNSPRSEWVSVRCFYDKYEIYCPSNQHTEDNMTCTGNSKQTQCDSSWELPNNASYNIKNVTITWNKENNRRSDPEKCGIICNDGYVWSGCNTRITHDPNSYISYTLNENENYTAGTITITNWTDTITMLDRNLWATAAGTGCEDPEWKHKCTWWNSIYWYHFQWWNNYGFNSADTSVTNNSVDVNTNGAIWSDSYNNKWYYGTTFIKSDSSHWYDYWTDSVENSPNHENLWWGGGDYNDINLWFWINNENRRWPCPEGFHVPSIWEWNKVLNMITWTVNKNNVSILHNNLLIPYAGWRDVEDATAKDLGSVAGLWSSSPSSASDHYIKGINFLINNHLDYAYGPHWYAASVRCFYNEYEVYSKSSSPNQNESSTSSNEGRSGGGRKSVVKSVTWNINENNPENNTVEKSEFQQAYEFAYENWITTMDTIQKADMEWPLTRIAMDKMLSNYAINVLGKKPANIIVPNFSDITTKLNEEYDFWVTLWYQLWIMWINMPNNKFRPFDLVTRAEFATALSRMLFSTPDGNPYYSTHIAKLKEEWIITNDNPDMQELRWYVMIMLMRSAKN